MGQRFDRGSIPASLDYCVDMLYMTLGDPSLLPVAASSLRALFNAGAVCLFTADAHDRVLSFAADGIDPEDQQRWVSHYSDVDPMRPFALASRPGQWMSNDDLLHPTRTTSPEYVNDFARGAGIRWFSGGKVAEDCWGSSFFTLQRPADRQPFDTETIGMLDTLLPHLQRVARLRMDLHAALRQPVSGAAAGDPYPGSLDPLGALDALAVAVCVVDIDGRIRFANQAASKLMSRLGLIGARARGADRFDLDSPAMNARLRSALGRACKGPRQASAFSAALTRLEAKLQLRVIPVSAGYAAGSGSAEGGATDALIFFSEGPARLRVDVLEQMHGLTAAESALVGLLAQGLSPQACAVARGVSVSTVRAQLSSILAKTGAASQTQLLSMVLSMHALP